MIRPTNKLELTCDGCGLWFEEFDPGSDVEAKLGFHRVTPISDGGGGAKHYCVECFNALWAKQPGSLLEVGAKPPPPFWTDDDGKASAKEGERSSPS